MTFSPVHSLIFQVPENVEFAQESSQFYKQLKDIYFKVAKAINGRDISLYTIEEILNGQKYINDDSSQNFIFRKVINTGALLNAAPTAVNHLLNGGAAVPATWMFTRIYGFARDPATPIWIPLPNGGIHDCSVQVTATQVVVTPTVNLAAFTQSYVVIEYWKA